MFKMWDVQDVGCLECGILGLWDVWDVECWDVGGSGSGYGMFGMWGVQDVKCL